MSYPQITQIFADDPTIPFFPPICECLLNLRTPFLT
jgi:hypothetical protein